MEQELHILPEHLSSPRHCLSFASSIYGVWLTLWQIQTCRTSNFKSLLVDLVSGLLGGFEWFLLLFFFSFYLFLYIFVLIYFFCFAFFLLQVSWNSNEKQHHVLYKIYRRFWKHYSLFAWYCKQKVIMNCFISIYFTRFNRHFQQINCWRWWRIQICQRSHK